MTIKNTSISKTKVVYLDLEIEVLNGKYVFKSYDKRKDFNFQIKKFPHLKGNIPKNPAYGVFTSQLVRYCRINLHLDSFIQDCKDIISKLLSQEFNKNILKNTYIQFCKRYLHLWAHFGADIKTPEIITQIF